METTTLVLFVLGYTSGVLCNQNRPSIPDNPVAKAIFLLAELSGTNTTAGASTTVDGFLTRKEMDDIFDKFDINGDGQIGETEFIAHWTIVKLGDMQHAVTLFHRADTDHDGFISRDPDFARLFYYFDRNDDKMISEEEFVTVWFDLSS